MRKVLQTFEMGEANSISAPMIGRSKTGDDPYRPCEEEEEEVDKPRYLAAVGALIYLATHTRPDITFATSVLASHSRKPTHRHWAAIKHLKVESASNISDMLTKALPAYKHRELVQAAGMRSLQELDQP